MNVTNAKECDRVHDLPSRGGSSKLFSLLVVELTFIFLKAEDLVNVMDNMMHERWSRNVVSMMMRLTEAHVAYLKKCTY